MLCEPYGIVLGTGNAICCMRIMDLYSFPQESVNGFLSVRETDRKMEKEQVIWSIWGTLYMPRQLLPQPLCSTIIFLV